MGTTTKCGTITYGISLIWQSAASKWPARVPHQLTCSPKDLVLSRFAHRGGHSRPLLFPSGPGVHVPPAHRRTDEGGRERRSRLRAGGGHFRPALRPRRRAATQECLRLVAVKSRTSAERRPPQRFHWSAQGNIDAVAQITHCPEMASQR